MNLLLVGATYKTAPLEVRERFSVSEPGNPPALHYLISHPSVDEAVIVSTCHRVEIVLEVHDEIAGMDAIRHFFKSFASLSFDELPGCFYVHRQHEAVRHLFRVASGLDSMVTGEPQVLGQVKKAYLLAKETGATGSVLDTVFSRVFTAAKRVRSETHVGEASVSVGSAAVEHAERELGSLRGRTVMIVGAGQMGELAARHLVSKGAATVLVSNRTYDDAVKLAGELNGTAIRFPEVWEAMERADIVISSTGCPQYVIRREDMEPVMAARQGRPLFLMDVAVPRDIDPAVAELPGCTVANVDALKETACQNLRQRQEAIAGAEGIIAEELAQFRARQESLQVVPTIVSLRERAEQIRRHELARMREVFGEMTPEQEQALEAITQGLVNKILHAPFTELKQAATRPDRSEFIGLFRTVFHLEQEETAAEAVALG